VINKNISILKGQCHEIFDPRFLSSNNTPWTSDSWAKAFLNAKIVLFNRVFPLGPYYALGILKLPLVVLLIMPHLVCLLILIPAKPAWPMI
jgi:hypothetical protein